MFFRVNKLVQGWCKTTKRNLYSPLRDPFHKLLIFGKSPQGPAGPGQGRKGRDAPRPQLIETHFRLTQVALIRNSDHYGSGVREVMIKRLNPLRKFRDTNLPSTYIQIIRVSGSAAKYSRKSVASSVRPFP